MRHKIISVLLPLPFDKTFDYIIPKEYTAEIGNIVKVPFANRTIYGVIWADSQNNIPENKIKPIEAVVSHIPALTPQIRSFIDWVAWYNIAPKGAVLKMLLSAPDALKPPAKQLCYKLAENASVNSKARRKIANLLADGFARTLSDIVKETGVTSATIRRFAACGGLEEHFVTIETNPSQHNIIKSQLKLSSQQKRASEQLAQKLYNGFSVTLIDGVTGSGKTEVYFDTIKQLIQIPNNITAPTNHGSNNITELPQILVLLPEIALSIQWLERFKQRFGSMPHIWHSATSTARKRETWRAVAQGKAQLVVGARSALFLPFRNLQLIIVDEEHEQSYKQEEGVIYQARDMAVARAYHGNIPIILASATPSIETINNVHNNKYDIVKLPERHGSAAMPQVQLIDMRQHRPPKQQWISNPLHTAINNNITAGKQTMLFINRRGYAPLLLCRLCGYRFGCPHCSSWLVQHKYPPRLQCHHCNFRTPIPPHCPECGAISQEAFAACGPGVERLAEEVSQLFPAANIALMTSDVINDTKSATELINSVISGDIDILIGTQMMAKGHHFSNLSLVGIIDADLGLEGGDLRAAERNWQLLHQLAGRAGREEHRGTVMIQTYMPNHPVMTALQQHDRDGFIKQEIQSRQQAQMPPFGKLAAIIISSSNDNAAHQFSHECVQAAPKYDNMTILGPAPAPLSILRGKYRYRLLLKTSHNINIQKLVRNWISPLKPPASVRIKIDIDPYSFV